MKQDVEALTPFSGEGLPLCPEVADVDTEAARLTKAKLPVVASVRAMRRADRLFRLVGLFQRRRVITAAAIASRLEVSERTVYRDIADLVGSGVPINGAAGVGYRLDRSSPADSA